MLTNHVLKMSVLTSKQSHSCKDLNGNRVP